MEVAAALLLAHLFQAVAQVIEVVVEKAAFLDEVNEHHPIQHQGGVPFAVCKVLDARDEVQKSSVFFFETVIEFFGDFIDIKGSAYPARNIGNGKIFFFVQREGYLFQLLYQGFARLILVIDMLTRSVCMSRFAFYPLPV